MDVTNYCNPNAISCYHWKTQGYSMTTMHAHNEYEIHFSRCDGLTFYVDDRMYPVERNSIFVFNSTDLHRISVPSDVLYERYIISFLPSAVSTLSDGEVDLLECFERRPEYVSPRLELGDAEAAWFTAMADRLHALFANMEQFGARLMLQLVLGEMLVFVNRMFREKAPRAEPVEIRVANHRMSDTIKYIDKHFTEGVRLSDIARHCHMEKSYLCRLFKRSTGMCITDYVNYRRISLAAERLRQGATTAEAAAECGFNSETYFITMFKRATGVTPHQYVRSLKRSPS